MRAQQLKHTIQIEQEVQVEWEASLEAMRAEAAENNLSPEERHIRKALKTMGFFTLRVIAKIRHRRAQRRASERELSELHQYAATKVQAAFRSWRARRAAAELRDPTVGERRQAALHGKCATAIQRFARGWLARAQVKRMLQGAKVIQRLFRCFAARRQLARRRRAAKKTELSGTQKHAARCLQRFFLTLVAATHARYRQHSSTLSVLHRVGRGYLSRLLVCEVEARRLDSAAATIQAMFRAVRTRAQIAHRRDGKKEEWILEVRDHAARIIQRAHRRFFAVKLFLKRRARQHAASVIQRNFRGFSARRRLEGVRAACAQSIQREVRKDAAVAIQSVFRGHQVRKLLRSTRSGSSAVAGENRSLYSDAAVILQRLYHRRLRARKLRDFVDRCARIIQRFIDRLPAIKEKNRRRQTAALAPVRNDAAVIVQTSIRSFLARRQVRQRQTQRNRLYDDVRRAEAARTITAFVRLVARRRRKNIREPQV
jgi:hypothetical protein